MLQRKRLKHNINVFGISCVICSLRLGADQVAWQWKNTLYN